MDLQKVKEALKAAAVIIDHNEWPLVLEAIEHALAELEKPAEDVELDDIVVKIYESAWDWGLGGGELETLIQQYAESYHAKKCAECVEQGQKSPCDFCESDSCPDCPVYNSEAPHA